jgi:hypothetical protein
MIPREQRDALTIASIGYRSPPRNIQPVLSEQFSWISQETLDILIEHGWLESMNIRFSRDENAPVYEAYAITKAGIEAYNEYVADIDE